MLFFIGQRRHARWMCKGVRRPPLLFCPCIQAHLQNFSLRPKKKKNRKKKKNPMPAIKCGEEILWWCHSNLTKLCIVPLSLGINFHKKKFDSICAFFKAFISEMVKNISSQKEFSLVTQTTPTPTPLALSPGSGFATTDNSQSLSLKRTFVQ